MAFAHLVGEPLRLVLERGDLGQSALLELRVPQVLRQAVVDLARESRPFLERRGDELGLGQAPDLHRRRPELGEVVPAVDDDPDEQDPVEGQAQQIPGRDDRGVAARVDRVVHLAERGDHEARRQERVAGTAAAPVGAMREQRGDDERGTDQALQHDQHRSRSGRQGRGRVGGDRVERLLWREHRQLVLHENAEQDEARRPPATDR